MLIWQYIIWRKEKPLYKDSKQIGVFNPLTPNDYYTGRTAPLTSNRCILYIYSTNIGTEYFKHGIYSPFFSSSKCSLFLNSNVFGSCIIHILFTRCAKIKKKIQRQNVKNCISIVGLAFWYRRIICIVQLQRHFKLVVWSDSGLEFFTVVVNACVLILLGVYRWKLRKDGNMLMEF